MGDITMLVEPTRELVLTKVREVFPHDDPAEILALLDRYGVESYKREAYRVQLAILWLSKGDRVSLVKHVDNEIRDYRDLLLWAGKWRREQNERYNAWFRGGDKVERE